MHGIWKSKDQRAAFWQEIDELLSRYPEVMNGLDLLYEHHDSNDCPCGEEYDPKTLKFFNGKVFILSCKNLDEHEGIVVLDPQEQSMYMTVGLLKKSMDYT